MVRRNDRASTDRGFTLIELLVVVIIIAIVSALALPTVLSALNTRQASEAGRILQGALMGARDKAIHDGVAGGIRLLPDPAYPITYPSGTQINPLATLAYNRIIPIAAAPEYDDGAVTVLAGSALNNYPAVATNPFGPQGGGGLPSLVIQAAPLDNNGVPNAPTNWFWNIRVGDRIQVDNAGAWYTVVGPCWISPSPLSVSLGNPELFVNVGVPGSPSPLGNDPVFNQPIEYLILTDGRDDDGDGWKDNGFDGVDNNGDTLVDNAIEWMPYTFNGVHFLGEAEQWQGTLATKGAASVPYTIRRRPAPVAGAREVELPSNVVIDATSWAGTRERSRLPVNPLTGYIDIVLKPDGTVLPTTIYGVPASVGMDQAFYHFWLAERQDLATVDTTQTVAPYLPVPPGVAPDGRFGGNAQIKGQYSILTLFARTGNMAVNQGPPFFFDPARGYTNQPSANAVYTPSNPFVPAEQGVR